ncbi:MAG: hypothetical protein H6867_00705 [Rhodospirillales bacterium]|nr:hypothetical protein [Rhodospirillales bacterium]MCB9996821.1 hypothetical protein [Rhodospirillales bacterium]
MTKLEKSVVALKSRREIGGEISLAGVFSEAGLTDLYEGDRVLEGRGLRCATVELTETEKDALKKTGKVTVEQHRSLAINI